jgi:hypothetical protein
MSSRLHFTANQISPQIINITWFAVNKQRLVGQKVLLTEERHYMKHRGQIY